MKKIVILFSLFFILSLSIDKANAQRAFHLGFKGGFSKPFFKEYSDHFDWGYALEASLFLHDTADATNLHLYGVKLAYHSWNPNKDEITKGQASWISNEYGLFYIEEWDVTGSKSLLAATPFIRLVHNHQKKLKPFVQAGLTGFLLMNDYELTGTKVIETAGGDEATNNRLIEKTIGEDDISMHGGVELGFGFTLGRIELMPQYSMILTGGTVGIFSVKLGIFL